MQDAMQIYLLLADGSCYPGLSFGHPPKDEFAEIVFTTGMGGYLETISDPSFSSQIILQTFPLQGNYGYIPEDLESSQAYCAGYCARHISKHPSNFRSQGTLDTYLREQGVVGIEGIDTRTLTRKIREQGVMNAVITADPVAIDVDAFKAFKPALQVPKVSVRETRTYPAKDNRLYRVSIPDTGVKQSIIESLQERGCEVTLFPHDTDPEAILAGQPDGILLGNGPGDPRDYADLVAKTRVLSDSALPLMAICLGHQLLALAHNAGIKKMKYGHRGENQGVVDLADGRIYMTSQNHGYLLTDIGVDSEQMKVSFRNVNDGSCEGVDYLQKPQFSVQFHPEAAPGPCETLFLFDRFISLMEAANATR